MRTSTLVLNLILGASLVAVLGNFYRIECMELEAAASTALETKSAPEKEESSTESEAQKIPAREVFDYSAFKSHFSRVVMFNRRNRSGGPNQPFLVGDELIFDHRPEWDGATKAKVVAHEGVWILIRNADGKFAQVARGNALLIQKGSFVEIYSTENPRICSARGVVLDVYVPNTTGIKMRQHEPMADIELEDGTLTKAAYYDLKLVE